MTYTISAKASMIINPSKEVDKKSVEEKTNKKLKILETFKGVAENVRLCRSVT